MLGTCWKRPPRFPFDHGAALSGELIASIADSPFSVNGTLCPGSDETAPAGYKRQRWTLPVLTRWTISLISPGRFTQPQSSRRDARIAIPALDDRRSPWKRLWKRQTSADGDRSPPQRRSDWLLSRQTVRTAAHCSSPRAISEYGVHAPSRVRIPPSPFREGAASSAFRRDGLVGVWGSRHPRTPSAGSVLEAGAFRSVPNWP
jgi:hypothetical protein